MACRLKDCEMLRVRKSNAEADPNQCAPDNAKGAVRCESGPSHNNRDSSIFVTWPRLSITMGFKAPPEGMHTKLELRHTIIQLQWRRLHQVWRKQAT